MPSLFQSVRSNFTGTLLSRITGLLRDVTLAFYFGASSELALFLVAYRWAFLLRRVVAEGSIQSTYVPLLKKWFKEDPIKATVLHRKFTKQVSLLVFSLCVLCIGLIEGLIIPLFFPHHASLLHLISLMIPVLLFLSLYALAMAFDHCHNIFFRSAFSPVLFNLTWIASAIYSSNFKEFSYILACGVVIGTALQWLFIFLRQRKLTNATVTLSHIDYTFDLKLILKNFSLATIGIVATQFNSGIDALFALAAHNKGPALLWYAMRLQQLPLALVSLSLFSALLPRFSHQTSISESQNLFTKAIKGIFALLCPIFMLIVVVGLPSIQLLFERGSFSSTDSLETFICLLGYSIGIIPMSINLIYQASFYAMSDYKSTLKASCYSIILNMALNSFFIYVLRAPVYTVALATSFSSMLQLAILSKQSKLQIFTKDSIKTLLSTVIASLISGVIPIIIISLYSLPIVLSIFINTLIYLAGYIALLYAFLPQVQYTFQNIIKRAFPSIIKNDLSI